MRRTQSLPFLLFVTVFLSSLTVGGALAAQTTDSAEPPASKSSSSSAPSTKLLLTKSFTLEGSKVWTDTAISLEPGQRVVVTAEGKLRYSDAKVDNGPEGLARGFKDLIRILPFNDAGRGALLGRIGDPDIAPPFLIGANKDVVAPVRGKFSIGINQSNSDTGDGSYTVNVTIYAAAGTAPKEVALLVISMPGIDNALFAKIPRRIGDKEGNPGDMVNFLIMGSEDDMKKAFTDAGWVKVDADVKSTILAGALASLSKESYLTMPMSQLYLFGRVQDYGWAHAEPITVVASRNHLRIWKAPFTVDGQTLWVGAATHDIGFEKDQRNNGVTHKIDPDIDLERDYVEKTLSSTGRVAEVTHFLPKNPLQEAKTATGGSFHSNGQVLVLKLENSDKSSTAANSSHYNRELFWIAADYCLVFAGCGACSDLRLSSAVLP
jgi:LssY C-terminus